MKIFLKHFGRMADIDFGKIKILKCACIIISGRLALFDAAAAAKQLFSFVCCEFESAAHPAHANACECICMCSFHMSMCSFHMRMCSFRMPIGCSKKKWFHIENFYYLN